MSNGISELLGRYGDELKRARAFQDSFATEAKKRQVSTEYPFLNAPQFFSSEEVAGLGLIDPATGQPFTIDEGWQLKVSTEVNGAEPGFSLIDPQGWELLEGDVWVSPEGKRYTWQELYELPEEEMPLSFSSRLARTTTGEISPWQLPTAENVQMLNEVLAELATFEDEDWENWFDQLQAEGPTFDNTAILSVLGFGSDEIDVFFEQPPMVTPASMTPKTKEERAFLLTTNFPDLSDEQVSGFFELGGTHESYVDWAWENLPALGIWNDKTFAEQFPDIKPELREGYIHRYGQYIDFDLLGKIQTGVFPPPSYDEQLAQSFTMGWRDVQGSLSGILGWLGWEGTEELKWINESKAIAEINYLAGMPLSIRETIDWGEWTDIDTWATWGVKAMRTAPYALSAIPAGIAAFYGGTWAAAAMGLPKLVTWIVGGFAGAAMNRPIESAMETGETYNDFIAQGYSHEEASEAAKEVFVNNMTLAGFDAFEIAMMLAPTPGWVPKRLLELGLVRTLRIAGKVIIVGLSEGGEEIFQDAFQRWARGEKWHWDPITQEVFSLGATMGVFMGLGGDIITSFTEKTYDSLPDDLKNKVDDRAAELREKGSPESSARFEAIGDLMATEPGISEAARQVISNEQATQQDFTSQIQSYLDSLNYKGRTATNRMAEIRELLATKGELAAGVGTRADLEIELANLQALDRLANMKMPQQVDSIITTIQSEINSRSKGEAAHLFPDHTTAQLNEMLRVYEEAKTGIRAVAAPTITEQLQSLYTEVQTEITAAQTAIKGLTGEEARIGRETLAGLERELRYIQNTLASFEKRPGLPEATVLRSTIMAAAKLRGLTKEQTREIITSISGRRQLRAVSQENLVKILEKIKKTRPRTIRGQRVITKKTEDKIESLRTVLIQDGRLTQKIFNRLLEQLGLRTSRYENAYRFITESEGKTLIRAMNDEAVIASWDIKVDEALAKHPEIKEERDKLNVRSGDTKETTFDGRPIKIRRGNELRSMRYYVLEIQKKTGAPIYDIWQKINAAHLVIRAKQQILLNKLEKAAGGPKAFASIARNQSALTRIENFIASKHKMGPPLPTDLTESERSLAEELERQLFAFRNDVRYARFMEAYAGHGGNIEGILMDIPDAPRRVIRRAMDILESKGTTALREFLDTQDFGVIQRGYSPLSIIKPRLYLQTVRATTFAKGHIQTREGVDYVGEETRDILSRYRSYVKQMMGLTDLAPLIRAFDRVFTKNAGKLANGQQVASVLSRGLNEMKGYREDGGFIVHMLERLYAQVASAVFWRPDLVLRNKFQNFAFNPDYHMGLFLHPQNRFMSKERRAWFEVFVAQQKGMEQDYLLYSQKPMPGFGWLTDLAHRTSLYPWSDKSNRAEAFFVRMNRVDRALSAYHKDGNLKKLINNSGLRDFEARQQAEALELLAMERVDYGIPGMPIVTGEEAFARFNAQQLVNNVHFLYDRAQRAPAEQGATGKTLGNILVFSRSWGERIVLQTQKLGDPKIPIGEKFTALRIVIGIIIAGLLAGEAYKRITGKEHNPYNPLNIISWTPGGLIVGVSEDISSTIYWITEAVQGNDYALGQLPGLISGCADLCLPFYKNIVQILDAALDKKDIDVEAMRKVRALIDDEYELRGGAHDVERTLLEAIQHALLAAKDQPASATDKLKNAEEQLGLPIEETTEPFSIEDPEVYDLKKFGQDINSVTRGMTPEQAEEEGFSALVIHYIRMREWREQYNAFSDKESPSYIEDDDERSEAREQWLKDNPEANAMMAFWGIAGVNFETKEAWDIAQKMFKDYGIPENAMPKSNVPADVVESYFKYWEAVDEYGANSPEARLIRSTDGAFEAWGEMPDDEGGRGWEPLDDVVGALEISVKWRELDEQYNGFSDRDSEFYLADADAREKARAELLAANPQYADDRRRRDAYNLEMPDNLIENYVEWFKVDRRGYTEDWYLLEHKDFYDTMVDLNQMMERDFSKVPDIKWRHLWENWTALDEQYDAVGDRESELYISSDRERDTYRKQLLRDNLQYRHDRRMREGIEYGLPETLLEDYVGYYEIPPKSEATDLWYIQHSNESYYEDDWYLLAHRALYQTAVDLRIWTEKDFSKVPTRTVWNLYRRWKDLPLGNMRREYEAEHPILDYWLHFTRGTKLENGLDDAWFAAHRTEIFAAASWDVNK